MPAPSFFRQLGLFVVPNFVEEGYGIELCRQMAVAPKEKALVVHPSGEDCLDEGQRKVETSFLAKDIGTPLKERFLRLKPDLEKHFHLALTGCEPPQYLIYQSGNFFKPHCDGGGSGNNETTRRRRVSAVVFLNRESQEPAADGYGMGHLTFYGLLAGPQWERCAFSLNAEPGLLIAFPSNTWHEVTPVSHGWRYTVVTWFYGPEALIPSERTD